MSTPARKQPKLLDAHDPPRRWRTRSQPKGEAIMVTERVKRLLRALRTHGPLPTPLLYPYWKDGEHTSYEKLLRALTKLFHEASTGGPFVVRPTELNPDKGVKHEPAWYDLSPAGYKIAQGESSIVLPTKRDHWYHRAMGACISASLETLAPDFGMRFLPFEEILASPKCPAPTKAAANQLAIMFEMQTGAVRPDGMPGIRSLKIEPDDVFGIEYEKDGKRALRFFAREDDRASEPFSRDEDSYEHGERTRQQSIKEKLDKYIQLFDRELYRSHFGLPNFRVMFVTSSEGRIGTWIKYLEGKPHADRFLFKSLPTFAPGHWTAPREPISELFEPWRTGAGLFDITTL